MEYVVFLLFGLTLAYSLFRLWYANRQIRQAKREQEIVIAEAIKNADRYPTLEEFGTFVRPERLDEE